MGNTVIPDGSVMCTAGSSQTTTNLEYSLTFTGNPGYLKPIVIDKYLDGTRATLASVTASVYTDGMTGEFIDYFATQCSGVYVKGDKSFQEVNYGSVLTSITSAETKLLKKCLGDSDGVTSNNVEVYDWDYGATDGTGPYMGGNPHIIKLVKKSPNDDYDGGKFYVLWWKSAANQFVLGNEIESTDEEYAVFVTDGVAERVYVDENDDGIMSQAWGKNESRVYAYFNQYSSLVYTNVDVSCETGNSTVEPRLDDGRLEHGRHVHHHQDLEGGGDRQHVPDVGGQVPHPARRRDQLGRLDPRRPGRRRQREHGLHPAHQVHAGDDGQLRVRLDVLEPRHLQRRGRPLRVLQGLHRPRLRHAVGPRHLG